MTDEEIEHRRDKCAGSRSHETVNRQLLQDHSKRVSRRLLEPLGEDVQPAEKERQPAKQSHTELQPIHLLGFGGDLLCKDRGEDHEPGCQ